MPKYKIEERGYVGSEPILGTPLRRVPHTIDPLYETPDGRFTVYRVTHDAAYFDASYHSWQWQDGDEPAHDNYNTKWQAVDALCHYLIERGLARWEER